MQKVQQSQNLQKSQKNQKSNKNKKTKKSPMSSAKQQKKEKFYCRFYIKGSCKNGNKCKYIHPVNVTPKEKNSDEKKPKQSEQKAGNENNRQDGSLEKIDSADNNLKTFRDFYYEKMIDSLRVQCFSCKNNELPMYLSCGCSSICESCVKSKKPCSQSNHEYDNTVYIK